MACRSCRHCLDILPRYNNPIGPRRAHNASIAIRRHFPAQVRTRNFHQTAGCRQDVGPPSEPTASKRSILGKIADLTRGVRSGLASSYQVYGAAESLYKLCAQQADYTISKEARKDGKLATTGDGEEIGTGGGMWHDDFKLLPTFSTWSQVTMLHMYLIATRLRCMDKDSYRNWQSQLVDHFFHDAEVKMDLTHELTTRSVRQKYLQDLFQTWRGLILAYDEGIVKGDAVLASAVWRNLFKGREDVDLRVLAAVVSWMRQTLQKLDRMEDVDLYVQQAQIFRLPAKAELFLVDQQTKELEGLIRTIDSAAPSRTGARS